MPRPWPSLMMVLSTPGGTETSANLGVVVVRAVMSPERWTD